MIIIIILIGGYPPTYMLVTTPICKLKVAIPIFMNIALESDTSTRDSINSLDQSHIALSDSLGDTAKLDHQPLVDMARNYRSSNSKTTNRSRQENQPNEEDTPSTLDSLRSQQQEDFSCLECLKSG